MNSLIELRNLYKEYRTSDLRQECLRDLSMSIPDGSFTAITGRSGTGKTTLFRILSGLDHDYRGTYLLKGKDVSHLSEEEWLKIRRENTGVIFQDFNLISILTVAENALLGVQLKGKACETTKLDEVLASLELLDKKDKFPGQLSGGEKQRTAIARVLLQDPDLILADEPTGNLDPQTSETVFALLQDLHAKGKTILLVTHDLQLAARTERVLVLEDGKVHV